MAIYPKNFTAGEFQGSGFFEELLRTVNSFTSEEYKRDRITGTDYSNVVLGSITAAMQVTSQFLLQYEISNQNVLLIQEQIENAQLNSELVRKQIEKLDAEIAINVKQLTLMDEQIKQAVSQTELIDKQVDQAVKQLELMDKQLETATAQIANTVAQTELVKQNTINAENQNILITKQQLKLDQDTLLIKQKTFTEQAQILDVVDGSEVSGVIGKQKKLYDKQAEGFDRDAEQKLSKIMVDTWTVRQTTDGATADTAGLQDSEIMKVLAKAKRGVNVT